MKPKRNAGAVECVVRHVTTFPDFCRNHKVTPTEKRQLVEHLASMRYRETMKLLDA
jgi:hypothetical protein